jgi:hypothetical protein
MKGFARRNALRGEGGILQPPCLFRKRRQEGLEIAHTRAFEVDNARLRLSTEQSRWQGIDQTSGLVTHWPWHATCVRFRQENQTHRGRIGNGIGTNESKTAR